MLRRILVVVVLLVSAVTAWRCVEDAVGESARDTVGSGGSTVSVVVDHHYQAQSADRVDIKIMCSGVMVDMVRYGEIDTLRLPEGAALVSKFRRSGRDEYSQVVTTVAAGLTWNPTRPASD